MVGLPHHFRIEQKLRRLLEAASVRLSSETDEQGLQVAMVTSEKHRLVSVDDVSICGYYRPHRLEVGSCGANFVGVNVKDLPQAHGLWDWRKADIQQLLSAL